MVGFTEDASLDLRMVLLHCLKRIPREGEENPER